MLTKVMNNIKLTSGVLLFLITLSASAQRNRKQTIILNDGSYIVGSIIVDSSDYLSIRVKRPHVITIGKSLVYNTKTNLRSGIPGSVDKTGYSIRLSASLLAGHNSEGNAASLSFHLSNGYQFSNGLSAGLGTGIEELDLVLMPLYLDLRFQPLKTRVSPYAWIKSGYGFPLSEEENEFYYDFGSYNEAKGGIMFSTGAGIALYSWKRNAVTVGVGYRYQKIRLLRENIWSELDNELVTRFNRIELLFGFIFR